MNKPYKPYLVDDDPDSETFGPFHDPESVSYHPPRLSWFAIAVLVLICVFGLLLVTLPLWWPW